MASSNPSFLQFWTIFENSIDWNTWRCGACITRCTASLTGASAYPLPDLLLEEPVAHADRRLEGELLALLQLGIGEAGVVLLQRRRWPKATWRASSLIT